MNNKGKNTDNQRKDALVYCRVSTTKQEEHGTSLDSQAAECIRYAEENGYRVAEVVKEAYSGADLFERPKLNEQREKIKAGAYDVVICYDVDRLSRDISHLAIINNEIERHGGELLFVNGDFDNTPEGKLMLSLKGYVAEVERVKIRERCVRGKKTKLQQGKLVRAADLYGYTFDKENGRRIINPIEAETVKRIFELYLSGTGINGVFKRLNDGGIASPAKNKRKLESAKFTNIARHGRTLWNKGAVYRILTEPAYSGVTISWRYKGKKGYEKGKKFYRIETRDQSEWIEMPEGTTPAIVSREQFKAVQDKLAKNKGEYTRNETKPELLRGMVFCGDCGRKMYPESEHGERIIYRCPSRQTIKCNGKRINAAKCETAVWAKVCEIVKNPNLINAEMERRQTDSQADREKIERERQDRKNLLAAIEAEIGKLVSRAATADETLWENFNQLLKLKALEKQRVSAAIGEIENRLASFDADNSAMRALAEFSNRVSVNLENFGFDEKRLTLESLNVKIIGNGRDFRLDVSMPQILEKQDYSSLSIDGRFARFREDNARQKIADDSAAARI